MRGRDHLPERQAGVPPKPAYAAGGRPGQEKGVGHG